LKKSEPLEGVSSNPQAVAAGGPARPAGPGSLADVLGPAPTVSLGESFPPLTLLKIAVLAVLLLAFCFWQIDWLVKKWVGDPNWTHGFVIPLFSLYLIYSRRDDLAAAPRRTCLPGLVLVVLCLLVQVLLVLTRVPGFLYLIQLCMVAMLFGLVLYLAGGKVIRVTWLPILFLVFALPIPDALYGRVSLPLQHLSAKGAVGMLRLLGVQISAVASRLDVVSRSDPSRVHTLTVAEACSGMHLLMAFLALGVAMAYLDYKPIWQRVILVASAVPIAVFCNVIRVAITCWMYHIDREEMGQGFMHYFTGLLMLIPAFLLLWLLALVLKSIFLEEAPEEPSSPQPQREVCS
jgi:exosortase